MQKGQAQVLILAGIVILIAVAGGIFYLGRATAPKPQSQTPMTTSSPQLSPTLSPTTSPDPTTNWKTYTNTKYGFSVSYPSEKTDVDCSQYGEGNCIGGGLQLLSEDNESKDLGDSQKIKQLATVAIGYPASDGLVKFTLYSNPNQLTTREWWEEAKVVYHVIHPGRETTDIGEKNFGQLQMFSVLLGDGIALQTYYLSHKNYILEIQDTLTDEKSEKIISTFKFLP